LKSSLNSLSRPWLLFLIWAVACSLLFWKPLSALCHYAINNDNASHIVLIPFLVAWLLYLDRHKIHRTSFDIVPASLFALSATILAIFVVRHIPLDPSSGLAATTLAYVLLLIAGFAGIFGRQSAIRARFPLAFLVLAIPFPEPLLNRIIYLLQAGSAAVAEWIFDWSGVPALREGFVFRLPRMSIEVATECSGIRSSIALLILALLVAHFSFVRFWKKAIFVFAGLLMMLVKNGVRIATLTILANYVDPDFLYGRLHREGGVVFFLIGLALLWPVYWLLKRDEKTHPILPSEASLS